MILYLGDKELFDFIYNLTENISMDITLSEADKVIVSEHTHNAVSLIRYAAEANIPVLGILDGYTSVAEAFDAECLHIENCSEGKQELAILDTTVPLHKNLGHVMPICRGNPLALSEDSMSNLLDCIARSEEGEIIAFSHKSVNGETNIFAVNYYINSTLTQYGETVLANFINLEQSGFAAADF